MVSVDDPSQYESKLEYQVDVLREAAESDTIATGDLEAILDVKTRKEQDGLAASTLRGYLIRLRNLASLDGPDLVELSSYSDVQSLLDRFWREYDVSQNSFRNVKVALRQFGNIHGESWADEIDTSRSSHGGQNTVQPDEILTEDEFQALLDNAYNMRDKAWLALLWDSACRVTAAASLRVGDIEIHGDHARFTFNDDALGLKGADGQKPLTRSKPYLASWLDLHPTGDDDHPLWHKLQRYSDGDRAVGVESHRSRMKRIADEASVAREKVYPHNMRHAAVARWILEDVNEQEIKFRAEWEEGSPMLETYGPVADMEMVEKILDARDLGDGDRDAGGGLDRCPQCGVPLPTSTVNFCPECGQGVSGEAREIDEEVREWGVSGGVGVDDPEVVEAIKTIVTASGGDLSSLEDLVGQRLSPPSDSSADR